MRVLVVEDHPIMGRVVERVLSQAGVEGTVATDGEQAVTLARTTAFDVIFMDVQLPGIDGIAAARMIIAAGDPPPIWGLTASIGTDEHQRCIDAGMAGVLEKPLTVEKLTAAAGAPSGREDDGES